MLRLLLICVGLGPCLGGCLLFARAELPTAQQLGQLSSQPVLGDGADAEVPARRSSRAQGVDPQAALRLAEQDRRRWGPMDVTDPDKLMRERNAAGARGSETLGNAIVGAPAPRR